MTAILSAFITAHDGTKLQYVDWGGHGETVVLLAGLGNTAAIYSDFAPRLTADFHVIGLTRRSHGRSGAATDFTPDASARDVRDMLDALHVRRAVLVGHSLAGSELTAFVRQFPERTAALVYLDAAYDRRLQATFIDDDPVPDREPTAGDRTSIPAWLRYRRRPDAFPGAYLRKIWGPAVEADSREAVEVLEDGSVRERYSPSAQGGFFTAAAAASPDYRGIKVPVLAIYAEPSHYPFLPEHASPGLRRQAEDFYRNRIVPWTTQSIGELRSQDQDAIVVEIPGSFHHVFIQHPKRVATLMESFLGSHGHATDMPDGSRGNTGPE